MSERLSLDEYISLETRRRNSEGMSEEDLARITEFKKALFEFEDGYGEPAVTPPHAVVAQEIARELDEFWGWPNPAEDGMRHLALHQSVLTAPDDFRIWLVEGLVSAWIEREGDAFALVVDWGNDLPAKAFGEGITKTGQFFWDRYAGDSNDGLSPTEVAAKNFVRSVSDFEVRETIALELIDTEGELKEPRLQASRVGWELANLPDDPADADLRRAIERGIGL